MKFHSPEVNPINGSQLVYDSFGPNAERRHRDFERYFVATNPLTPIPCQKTHPNHKLNKFFKHSMKVSKKYMFLGRFISGDEQTIGMLLSHNYLF